MTYCLNGGRRSMKKKILVVYDAMITGGTTTGIIPFLKVLSSVYDVDLLLYKNDGEHMDQIVDSVTILPEARKSKKDISILDRVKIIVKVVESIVTYLAITKKYDAVEIKKRVLSVISLVGLSRNINKKYDIAIGFIEGWADKYVATKVKASKKIAWIHAQIDYIVSNPKLETDWMKSINKYVFVTQANKDRFDLMFQDYLYMSSVCENIVDNENIVKKAQITPNDEKYSFFADFTGIKMITVCRLTENIKGIDRIIKFAKLLKINRIQFRWCILGDGKDRISIENQIKENNIEDCLFLFGNMSNPFPFVKAADVFVLLSRYEGKPICITESLIIGTPAIVTHYPSADEQIICGFNGIIVDNSDEAINSFSLEFAQGKYDIKRMKENLSKNPFEVKSPIGDIIKVIED